MAISQLYPTQRPALDLNFARQKRLDSRVTFTRGSTATYVGSDGLIKTAAANEARFDHDPATGESLGLLVEESRTNLLTQSSALHTWFTSFSPTITANTTSAPDGTITATSLVPASGQSNQIFQPNSDNKKSLSVFAKANGYDHIILVAQSAPTTSAGVLFNLTGDGSVVATNYGATGSIQKLANGWYRCIMTRSSTDAATMNTFIIRAADSSTPSGSYWSQSSFLGDGTSGVYIWGAQHEDGSFSTSYIPTSGSTVTRSTDVASMTGTNFSSWYNQSEGTFFVRTQAFGSLKACSVSTGPGDYQNTMHYIGSNSETFGASFLGFQPNYSLSFTNSGWTDSKIMGNYIGAYSSSDVAATYNGGTVQSSSLSSPPSSNNTHFFIGRTHNFLQSMHRISRLTYYPTRLSNDQLQALTL